MGDLPRTSLSFVMLLVNRFASSFCTLFTRSGTREVDLIALNSQALEMICPSDRIPFLSLSTSKQRLCVLNNDHEITLSDAVGEEEKPGQRQERPEIERATHESPSETVTRCTLPLTGDETICSIFMALRTQMLWRRKDRQRGKARL